MPFAYQPEELPTPKKCPVCGKKLVNKKQRMVMVRSQWVGRNDLRTINTVVHRKRMVCTKCKVAVVLHRVRKGS